MKIKHEYFKSFQFKLSNWTQSFRIENDLCPKCQTQETSNHLILKCKRFEKKIDLMKIKFFHAINFPYLFTISGQSLLIDYLQKIQIAIR